MGRRSASSLITWAMVPRMGLLWSNRYGWVLLAVAILAPLPLFWFGFVGLWHEWALPEHLFKRYVPLLSLALLYRSNQARSLSAASRGGPWCGVLVVAFGLLLAVVGHLEELDDFVFLAIAVYTVGLVVILFGVRNSLTLWIPIAFLAFMLPIPRIIYRDLIQPFEKAATELGMSGLQLAGVPVDLTGTMLDFGAVQLSVGDATAGLSNLLPVLMILLFLLAYFRRRPLIVPLILAVPVIVSLAGLQIVAIGIAAGHLGSDLGDLPLRLARQWLVFACAAAILFSIGLVALRWAGPRAVTAGRVGPRLKEVRRAPVEPGPLLLAALLSAVAFSTTFVGSPRQSGPIERDAFWLFPPEIAGWSGSNWVIDRGTMSVLQADDYIQMVYWNENERAEVSFWSAYYHTQRPSRGSIHSPERCLPLDGWNILTFHRTEIFLPGKVPEGLWVNRATITRDGVTSLVYYWFEGRGQRVAHEIKARMLARLDSLRIGRTDGALVRFVTPILPDESESDADARLQRFLTVAIDHLPRFIPE